MVPWMSGLVNGLQNRLRRFESARHLRVGIKMVPTFYFARFPVYFHFSRIFAEKMYVIWKIFSIFADALWIYTNSLY